MDKQTVLRLLQNYFSDIDVYDDFIFELMQIIAETGTEKDVVRLRSHRLALLRNLGVQAIKHKEFESLGRHLYSMHLTGNGFNIRIIYAFLNSDRPVLLLPFYERAGKNRTDYSPNILRATTRLKEIKGEQ